MKKSVKKPNYSYLAHSFKNDSSISYDEKVAILSQLLIHCFNGMKSPLGPLAAAKDIYDGIRDFLDISESSESKHLDSPEAEELFCAATSLYAIELTASCYYEEALVLFDEVLQMSSSDPLGTRYYLVPLLVRTGKIDQARQLLDLYSEPGAIFLYNFALLEYQAGNKEAFANRIAAAYEADSLTALLLTGTRKLRKRQSSGWVPEEEGREESHWYAERIGPLWKEIPGAIEAVRAAIEGKIIPKKRQRVGLQLLSKERFQTFREEILSSDLSNKKSLFSIYFRWASELFAQSPWRVYAERPAIISFEGKERELVAHFSGTLGDIRGCNVYSSVEIYEDLIFRLHMTEGLYHDERYRQVNIGTQGWSANSITVSLQRASDLHKRDRLEIETAMGHMPYEMEVPVGENKLQGYAPWFLTDSDRLTTLCGLYGLAYRMTVPFKTTDGDLQVTLDPELSTHILKHQKILLSRELHLVNSQNDAISNLKKKIFEVMGKASPSDAVWETGFVCPNAIIGSSPAARGQLICFAIVVETSQGLVVGCDHTCGNQPPKRALAKALLLAIKQTQLIPQSVKILDSSLSPHMCELLDELKISYEVVNEAPSFIEAAFELLKNGLKNEKVLIH